MNSQARLIASAGWMAGLARTASGRRHSITAARITNPMPTRADVAGGSPCRNVIEIS